MGRKIISLMIIFVNIIGLLLANPAVVEASTPKGYEKVAENINFKLYFNKDLASIAVESKSTGKIWTSVPEDWQEDSIAKGANKFNLASQLVIEAYDENKKPVVFNTYNFSVKKKAYKYNEIKNGIRVDYNIQGKGICISIECMLDDYGLSVRVPVDSIKEGYYSEEEKKNAKKNKTKLETYLISQIKIMPFFGAAKKADDGYLFIPDGCGALIRFDDNLGAFREISKTVYGWDKAVPITEMPPKEEIYRMPVFGIKKNDAALFGIIESGDFNVNINSAIAGDNAQYFRVYPSFVYRDTHKIVLFEGDSRERFVLKLSPNSMTSDLKISYYFLQGDKANYSGMAETYRNYLVESNLLMGRIEGEMKFNLTLLGGVKKRKIFLGIPLEMLEPLTTFKQAQKILEELRSRGVSDISLRYVGINKGGYHSQWDNTIAPERKLGGKRGFKNFIKYAENNDIELFLNAELNEVYKTGRGFSQSRDAMRFVSNATGFQWKWSPINKEKEQGVRGWFLLTPAKVLNLLSSFLKSFNRFSLDNLSLDTIGETVYSDYRNDRLIYRDEAGAIWKDIMKKANDEAKKLMVTGGNAYTFPYVSAITDVPMDYSGFDMTTEPVPFYQMVIHGFIAYTGTASNLRNDTRTEFLRMIEYGAMPRYEWIYAESSVLKESRFNNLYSGCYKDWINDAVSEYNEIKEVYKDIYDKMMIGHEKLAEGVFKTTYENGISIIVNYNNSDYIKGSIRVKANGYSVQKGGI